MDCKFTLHCNKCGCNTELSAESWMPSGRFAYPNCHAGLPCEIYSALADTIGRIALVKAESETFSISVTYPLGKEHHS